jgi:CubicO group peptidase (beta-lactamase class C family)
MPVADRLRETLAASGDLAVGGAVAAVAVGGEQVALAHGTANLHTGAPMTSDTGFLLGSVTKVLTTTVLLRLVDRGEVGLDDPVRRHVPEFTLRDRDAADAVTVRMLVNHTNGMDADSLMPSAVRGRDASRSYTAHLPNIGVVFEPGCGIHYTNPGFVVAARVIEEHTGLPFERAIQQELLDPAGLADATLVQTQALLRRTAVGAFAAAGGGVRATDVFTLPESGAGAGSTAVVTVADMLTFGRLHLDGGGAVLSRDLVELMREPEHDLGLPGSYPIGLGWWLAPICGTTAYWHAGGSPGGTSSFCIVPDLDAVVISFATGPGGPLLNDLLHGAALEEVSGRAVEAPLAYAPEPVDPSLAGEYRSFEKHTTLEVDGDELVVVDRYVAYDDDHRATNEGYTGTAETESTTRYRSVAPGQYAPGADGGVPESCYGLFGRRSLLAALPPADGRPAGFQLGSRFTPRVAS